MPARLVTTAALLAALLTGASARAQDRTDLGTPPDLPLLAKPEPPAASPVWEGAFGFNTAYRPEYQGASRNKFNLTPALFLRYGRFTITNASGFVTRRADDVVRGLGVDMLQGERVRVSLALRFDAGRGENSSADLTGLGNVKSTVRARVNASWRLDDGWRTGASWSVDAFGRGGGNFGDVSFGREMVLPGGITVGAGAALSFAGDRYMQTYYGVTPEQAARSGYAVYAPHSGLRDVSLSVNGRTDIGRDWVMLGGAGISRLLGPAADSPITRKPDGWAVNLGIARRF